MFVYACKDCGSSARTRIKEKREWINREGKAKNLPGNLGEPTTSSLLCPTLRKDPKKEEKKENKRNFFSLSHIRFSFVAFCVLVLRGKMLLGNSFAYSSDSQKAKYGKDAFQNLTNQLASRTQQFLRKFKESKSLSSSVYKVSKVFCFNSIE